MNVTNKAHASQVAAIVAVSEAIRELGSVPSGEFYARIMGAMTLDAYQSILGVLQRAKLIEVTSDVITWIGPQIGANS